MTGRIVDGAVLDAELGFERLPQQVAVHIFCHDRWKLVIRVAELRRVPRDLEPVGACQLLPVPVDQLVPIIHPLVEPLELRQPRDGVDLAHAPVAAHRDEILAALSLTVMTHEPRIFRQLLVVGRDHAADTAGHDLGRIERKDAGVRETSSFALADRRAVCV